MALLPSGYTRLEYINSNGSANINTGITDTDYGQDFKIRMKFRANGNGDYTPQIFGNYIDEAHNCWRLIRETAANGGRGYINMGDLASRAHEVELYDWTVYDVEMGRSGKSVYYRVNGATWNDALHVQVQINSNPIYIFTQSGSGGTWSGPTLDIFDFRIWVGDNLVRNFVPCKKNSNSEISMYDVVSGTFFSHNGTFTAGPVASSPFRPASDAFAKSSDTKTYTNCGYIRSNAASGCFIDLRTENGHGSEGEPIKFNAETDDFYLDASWINEGSSINEMLLSWGGTTPGSGWLYNYGGADAVTLYMFTTSGAQVGLTYKTPGVSVGGAGDAVTNVVWGYKSKVAYIDDVVSSQPTVESYVFDYVSASLPMRLFAGSDGYNNSYRSHAIFRGLTHYRNGALIHNWIPAVSSDGYYGVYDTIENIFRYASTASAITGMPTAYAPVSYLRSDGNQKIDSGFSENGPVISICCDFYNPNATGNYLFGSQQNSAAMMCFGAYSNSIVEVAYAEIRYTASQFLRLRSTWAYGYGNDGLNYRINDGSYAHWTHAIASGSGNHWIFACNGGSRLYARELWLMKSGYVLIHLQGGKTNAQVRHFIPVVNKSTGAYGLIDALTNSFYGNSGSGSFTGGARLDKQYSTWRRSHRQPVNDKNPDSVVRLEYIQTSGNSSFNTNVKFDGPIRVSMEIEYTTTAPANQIMGFTGNGWCGIGTAGSNWWEWGGPLVANTRYRIEFGRFGTQTWRKINGKSVYAEGSTIPSGWPLLLFSARTSASDSSVNYRCSCKMYWCKIYKENGCVHDYVPAKRSGSVCLYDKINGMMYQVSGATAGPEAKWIESEPMIYA